MSVRNVLVAGLVLVTLLGAPAPAQDPANDAARMHRVIPAGSLGASQVRRVLNSAALELLLGRDYVEPEATESDARTRSIPGVMLSRAFRKGDRSLELASARAAGAGFDIHIYGRGGDGPNPDVAELEAKLTQLVAAAASAPDPATPAGMPGAMPGAMPGGVPGMDPSMAGQGAAPPPSGGAPRLEAYGNLGHSIYELSFTQADRALAMLKALGYATVEFQVAAGESPYDKLYSPSTSVGRDLPLVVKMIDAPKTSLMDTDPASRPAPGAMAMPMPQAFGGQERKAVPDIGGTFLHTPTSGEPQQRLLILYDRADPGPMERLVEILREEVDVPARQVVISALVLEVNTDKARELGVQFKGGDGRSQFNFEINPLTGLQQPLSYTLDTAQPHTRFDISVTIKALVDSGEAEVLSNPSVLVLDGRQARIQVGQQVPVVNTTAVANSGGISSSVEYFPVGIVLNLRPRVSQDGSEVTMQVETIISAVAQQQVFLSNVVYAPTVDNRQVQTFVRVADNTPFIIGGLISTSDINRRSGLPWLSKIPVLGALFRKDSIQTTKREVIVVLTPHVVPEEDRSFSYVIPKDSGRFDSFGHVLYRNSYRIRTTDLFDLDFVRESAILAGLVGKIRQKAELDPSLDRREPFASLLAGHVPGEEVLVNRMLWEIVRRSGYAQKIDPKQILVFQPSTADPTGTDFDISFLDGRLAALSPKQNALLMTFDAVNRGTAEHPFAQPKAEMRYESITPEGFRRRLIETNRRSADGTPESWSIVLSDAYTGTSRPLDTLRAVLVLKRILALNSSLPKTIKSFNVGRQIIFPTEEDVKRSIFAIDHQTAKLFYEVTEYYRAFEEEFNRTTRQVLRELDGK